MKWIENCKFFSQKTFIMSTDELKLDLIGKIQTIDDTSLLEEVKQLLDFEISGVYTM
jgi:hypothetical protein